MLTSEQLSYIRAEGTKRAEARLNGLTPRELRQWALKALVMNERAKLMMEAQTEEVHGG